MREWLLVRKEYLQSVVAIDGYAVQRKCTSCKSRDGSWRCLDCLARPLLCIGCCRESHARLPFHRVERWCGTHFTPAWLQEVGVGIYLGHGGQKCPSPILGSSSDVDTGTSAAPVLQDESANNPFDLFDDGWEDDENEERNTYLHYGPPRPGSLDANGHQIMIIVDRSGIHHIGIHFCDCPSAKSADLQLLDMGIYPASQKRPKTGFTFGVLDDFLVDNRECKVSALRFYSKLRRITSNAFPASAPVCCCIRLYRRNSHSGFRIDTENYFVYLGSGEISSTASGTALLTQNQNHSLEIWLSFVLLVLNLE